MFHHVLAVETSCDDTSVAIINHNHVVLTQVTASQDFIHTPFGGVIPELASRNHTISLLPLINEALSKAKLKLNDIDGFAVTNRPGLIGSLIVGLMTIKSVAQALQKPFIGINHLEGHIRAPFLKDESYNPAFSIENDFITLAVSGGHSSIYWCPKSQAHSGQFTIIGTTKDDAAGEAFDKFAKMLKLPYPGGVHVDKLAALGDPNKFVFPRSLISENNLNMSFSGLKSSAQRLLAKMDEDEINNCKNDLCASFQEAIIDVLFAKTIRAAKLMKTKKIAITGGVSANSRLRFEIEKYKNEGYEFVIPPLRYCTDNAAMIGLAGLIKFNNGLTSELNLGPSSSSLDSDFFIQLKENL